MKKIGYIFTCIAFSVQVYGQDPNQYLPSPNATTLAKYSEIPVSYYTGTPSINVPLYTIEDNNFPISISLGYHGGGLKTTAKSGCVGLGWALNAGGVITRVIRGLPDEKEPIPTGYNYGDGVTYEIGGFAKINQGTRNLIYDVAIRGVKFLMNDEIVYTGHDGIVERSKAFQSVYEPYKEGKLDIHPDNYNFNFMGHSGTFTLGKDGMPIVQCSSNVYLSFFSSGGNKIEFTDEYGFVYIFSDVENILVVGRDNELDRLYPSSWYLSEIYFKDINHEKQLIATFSYKQIKYSFLDYALQHGQPTEQWSSPQPPLDGYGVLSNTGFSEYKYEYGTQPITGDFNNRQTIFTSFFDKNLILDEINTANWRIKFISLEEKRDDTFLNDRIDEVKIYDKREVVDDLFRHYKFSYSYFYNANPTGINIRGSHLKLDKVELVNTTDKTKVLPYYAFDYFRPLISLASEERTPYYYFPSDRSAGFDYWGYVNRSPSNDVSSALPFGNENYNRYSSLDFAPTGMLTKIIYPTGGSTIFNWECNTYSHIGYKKMTYRDPFCIVPIDTLTEKQELNVYANGHSPGNVTGSIYLTEGASVEISANGFYPENACGMSWQDINCDINIYDIYYGCLDWNDNSLRGMLSLLPSRLPIVYLASSNTDPDELTYEKLCAPKIDNINECTYIKRAVIPYDYTNDPSKKILLTAPADGYYKVGVIPGYIKEGSITGDLFGSPELYALGGINIKHWHEDPTTHPSNVAINPHIGAAGGVRIASIIEIDSDGKEIKSERFNYNTIENGNEISTGVLVNEPIFTRHFLHAEVDKITLLPAYRISTEHAAINTSLNLTQGSCIGYSKVTINDKFGGKIIKNFSNAKEYPDVNENENNGVFYTSAFLLPNSGYAADGLLINDQITSFDFKRGHLDSELYLNNNNDIVRQVFYEYHIVKQDNNYVPGSMITIFYEDAAWGDEYVLGKYRLFPNKYYLDKEIIIDYYNEEKLSDTTEYTYSSYSATEKGNIIEKNSKTSTGDYFIQRFNYWRGRPSYVKNSKGGTVISATKTEYDHYFPVNERIAHIYGQQLQDNGTPMVDVSYEIQVERRFQNYDSKGDYFNQQLIEERYYDGTVVSFLYDNNDRMRMMVKGINSVDLELIVPNFVVSQSLPVIKNLITTSHPHVEIFSADYCRFGIKSKTDFNNITIFYEYDNFGRLMCIKDSNGDIIKAYSYNYKK